MRPAGCRSAVAQSSPDGLGIAGLMLVSVSQRVVGKHPHRHARAGVKLPQDRLHGVRHNTNVPPWQS